MSVERLQSSRSFADCISGTFAIPFRHGRQGPAVCTARGSLCDLFGSHWPKHFLLRVARGFATALSHYDPGSACSVVIVSCGRPPYMLVAIQRNVTGTRVLCGIERPNAELQCHVLRLFQAESNCCSTLQSTYLLRWRELASH